MKKKTILSMILIAILTSSLIACSDKKNNYNVTISEGPDEVEEVGEVEEIEDNEMLEENIKEESNLIFVEESWRNSRISIKLGDEEVLVAPALGGTVDWMHITDIKDAKDLTYLIAEEKTGDIRTYRYKNYSPNYNPNLDQNDEDNVAFLESQTAKGVDSDSSFKYSVSEGSLEIINPYANVIMKDENDADYTILVDGIETYKLTRYDTGDIYKGAKGEHSRPRFGFKIETLNKNNIIKEIDAISAALLILNNKYVFY